MTTFALRRPIELPLIAGSLAASADVGIESGLPSWRSAMSAWQWLELTTANISAVGPASIPASTSGGVNNVGGARVGRVDAWNGMANIGTRVHKAGVGGHTDWAGNEGYQCELNVESPVWVMLGAPTTDANIVIDVTHYLDGRPSASHTYYGLHGDATRGKVFRMGLGSAYGSGNFQRRNVDAFDVAAQDWDAANTWPEVPEAIVYGKAQCQDPRNGNVYVAGNTNLWRWNMSAGTWTQLAAIPENGSAAYYRGSVVDTLRNRVVVLGNEYIANGVMIFDITAGTWSTATSLTGTYAGDVSGAGGNAAHYNDDDDRIYCCSGNAGQIIEVHPSTFATSLKATTGATVPSPIHGVFQKFVRVDALGGYAYQPRGDSKLWFLASN